MKDGPFTQDYAEQYGEKLEVEMNEIRVGDLLVSQRDGYVLRDIVYSVVPDPGDNKVEVDFQITRGDTVGLSGGATHTVYRPTF